MNILREVVDLLEHQEALPIYPRSSPRPEHVPGVAEPKPGRKLLPIADPAEGARDDVVDLRPVPDNLVVEGVERGLLRGLLKGPTKIKLSNYDFSGSALVHHCIKWVQSHSNLLILSTTFCSRAGVFIIELLSIPSDSEQQT